MLNLGVVMQCAAESAGQVPSIARIHSLASDPELNGTTCIVLEMDQSSEHYKIQLADGRRIELKLANLQMVPARNPTVVNQFYSP